MLMFRAVWMVFAILLGLPTIGWASPAQELVPVAVLATDTAGTIAMRYGVSVEQVQMWNNLDSADLEGRTEVLVKKGAPPTTKKRKALPVVHVVKRGETLGKIAKKYRVPVKKILRWNRKVKPTRLQIGQELRLYIPGRNGRSVSWGKANRGRLYNGVALERTEGLRVRRVSRAYGTRRVVNLLEAAGADIKVWWPDAVDLTVGDLSYKRGGSMRPHLSHQSGRDADISYYHRGNVKTRDFLDMTSETFDPAKNWHFFKRLIDTGQVEYIFVDYALQKSLHSYARSIGYSAEELIPILQYPAPRGVRKSIIRHAKGHDDHFHIRFVCGPEDRNCR